MSKSAILLVGGMGTRLHPITLNIPKPMLPVAGIPFTEHQIVKAREAGIDEIVLATSFKAELFEPYFGNGKNFGISIRYAVEETPLGTGGAIRNAAKMLSGDGLVAIFNGDVLSGHDLEGQFKFHQEKGADVSLFLTQVSDARSFGAVELDNENRVLAFNEKMENPPTNTINAGCYIFNKEILYKIPEGKVVSVERETFPNFLSEGVRVFGFIDNSYWLDIGNPSALLQATKDLISGKAISAATPQRTQGAVILPGAVVDSSAKVINGSVIGANCRVGARAVIDNSILFDGSEVGADVEIFSSFVAKDFKIPSGVIGISNFFGF